MLKGFTRVLHIAPVLAKNHVVTLSDRELSAHITKRYKPQSGTITDLRKVKTEIREMSLEVSGNQVAGVRSYSAMLSVCARYKNPEAALKFWLEMTARKIKPDHFTYVSLASAFASIGKVKEVEQTLAKGGMKSHAAKGVLLRCYSKAKLSTKLMKTLKYFMDDTDFKFTARHAVVIISGQTDPLKAFQILLRLRTHYGVLPTTIMCNACISVCIKKKDQTIADKVIRYMQDNNIIKDSTTMASLANIYAAKGDFRGVEEVMEMTVEAKIPLNTSIYNAYLECCVSRTQRIDDTYQKRGRLMYQTALAAGFENSPHIQTSMLRLLVAVKDDDRITDLFSSAAGGISRASKKFHRIYSEYKSGKSVAEPLSLEMQRQKELDDFIITIPAHQIPSNSKKEKPKMTGAALFSSSSELSEVTAGLMHKDMGLSKFSAPSDADTTWVFNSDTSDLTTEWKWGKPPDFPKHPMQAKTGVNLWVSSPKKH